MVELLGYLAANGFRNYIASGGGQHRRRLGDRVLTTRLMGCRAKWSHQCRAERLTAVT
jgi:hypothetical protein